MGVRWVLGARPGSGPGSGMPWGLLWVLGRVLLISSGFCIASVGRISLANENLTSRELYSSYTINM